MVRFCDIFTQCRHVKGTCYHDGCRGNAADVTNMLVLCCTFVLPAKICFTSLNHNAHTHGLSMNVRTTRSPSQSARGILSGTDPQNDEYKARGGSVWVFQHVLFIYACLNKRYELLITECAFYAAHKRLPYAPLLTFEPALL